MTEASGPFLFTCGGCERAGPVPLILRCHVVVSEAALETISGSKQQCFLDSARYGRCRGGGGQGWYFHAIGIARVWCSSKGLGGRRAFYERADSIPHKVAGRQAHWLSQHEVHGIVLEILATVWCPLHEFPRTVPVEFLRKEASSFVSHKNLNTLMPESFETSSETYCKDPYSNPLVLAGKGAAAPLGTPRRFSAGAFGWVWD